jgi:hypothetical protein
VSVGPKVATSHENDVDNGPSIEEMSNASSEEFPLMWLRSFDKIVGGRTEADTLYHLRR